MTKDLNKENVEQALIEIGHALKDFSQKHKIFILMGELFEYLYKHMDDNRALGRACLLQSWDIACDAYQKKESKDESKQFTSDN